VDKDATVSAADIARLTGYGRAAVSNWRRRHDDFPAPVGGTSSSPLFALSQVETWLEAQGKHVAVPPEERLWQQIRTAVDDLRLPDLVADLCFFLQEGGGAGDLHAETEEVAERLGRAQTIEFLVERFAEAHNRRVAVTPHETAELMAALTATAGGTVLDPACGLGPLLTAARSYRPESLLGQDRDDYAVKITRARLDSPDIHLGDSLKADALSGARVDAVLCDPPFADRSWGYEELSSDPRWTYGLPPRGEPELAWVQHALWHLKPGGQAAVLMPAAAADRRSGRRIRAQLLRTGALRAVFELPPGSSSGSSAITHLWLLRRPKPNDPLPSHVLMMDVSTQASDLKQRVTQGWQSFLESPGEATAQGKGIPLIDLLDEQVDLTPSRHVVQSVATGRDFATTGKTLLGLLTAVAEAAKALAALTAETRDLPMTTIGELIQSGAVSFRQSPLRMETEQGDVPVLTAKDVLLSRSASGRTTDRPGLVMLEPGDVVVPLIARQIEAHVVWGDGFAAGPQLQVFRPDLSRCDPYFLACFLRAAGISRAGTTASKADIRRAAVPRLPLEAQQPYGSAFQRLQALASGLDGIADAGATFVGLGYEGLASGRLRPH
jgi:hypothetical protein